MRRIEVSLLRKICGRFVNQQPENLRKGAMFVPVLTENLLQNVFTQPGPISAFRDGQKRPEAVIHTRLPSLHSEQRDRLEPNIQCSRPVNRSSGNPAAPTASAFISVPSKSAGLSSPIRALVQ